MNISVVEVGQSKKKLSRNILIHQRPHSIKGEKICIIIIFLENILKSIAVSF